MAVNKKPSPPPPPSPPVPSFIFLFNCFLYILKVVVPRMQCTTNPQLNAIVHQVINDEGEGVILQKCGSIYEYGRTPNLLKLKVYLVPSIYSPPPSLLPLPPPSLPPFHSYTGTPKCGLKCEYGRTPILLRLKYHSGRQIFSSHLPFSLHSSPSIPPLLLFPLRKE